MSKLAYIVQLNLPGNPIKIGCTRNPWSRFDAFNHGTPVECRFVGLTIDGVHREREMLAATSDAEIKGEWRYATAPLIRLLRKYHEAGEWFVFTPDNLDWDDIRARALAVGPEFKDYLSQRLSPRSLRPNISLSATNLGSSGNLLATLWFRPQSTGAPPASPDRAEAA